MIYIYSTLSADQDYCLYDKNTDAHSLPVPVRVIRVNGKANVMNDKTFLTPRGALTSITEDDLKVLQQIPAFQKHAKANYLTVEKSKADPDEVAKDLVKKDKGAQLTEDDFDPEKQPKVNKLSLIHI